MLRELIISVSGCGRYFHWMPPMHKLAVAFFYACAILSMSVTAHAGAEGVPELLKGAALLNAFKAPFTASIIVTMDRGTRCSTHD
jgi:hypothetical protein